MNLTQLRTTSLFAFALATANLTLSAQDRPPTDRPDAPRAERGDQEAQPERGRMIQERLERMKREIGELREAGKVDEAREKERNFAEAMKRLKEESQGEGQPDRGRMEEKLGQMKRQIAELREAGKKEQAEEMSRHLEDAMRQLKQDRPMARGGERMQHLEQAIKHVEAAGLPEVSNDLRKVAAHLREEMERQERESHERRGNLGEGVRKEVQDLRRELERTREEMQRIQRELRELRAKSGAADKHE